MKPGKISLLRLAHAAATLRALREAGFSKELTYHAYHTLQGYALGFTLQEPPPRDGA